MVIGLVYKNFVTFIKSLFYIRKLYKTLKYNNLYQDKRCFIIGTGPSLKTDDLNMLENEVTFASNSIYKIFSNTNWKPTFYTVSDRKYLHQNLNEINEVDGVVKIYPLDLQGVVKESEAVYYYPRVFGLKGQSSFGGKSNFFVYDGATVTFHLIQIALFMGFKELYLLGIDFNYSLMIDESGKIVKNGSTKDYFSGQIASSNINIPSLQGSMENYLAAKVYCDANNIQIYNATRGGKLEVFERVKLEDLF